MSSAVLEQAGMDATDKFITTWNSRDPASWAESLHFPHVRPSPTGPIRVAATKADYISAVDFQPVIESGWDHSEWDYRHVLHISPNRIHVVGQWSRYNSDGNVILTTPVIYVCTRIDGQWGIQSRFGADYVDEDTDTSGFLTRGMNLLHDFINNQNTGNQASAAELLNYPHFNIGVGELNVTEQASDFKLAGVPIKVESMMGLQTGLHSMNIGIELMVQTEEGEHQLQGVVHLNDRDNHLGIQAWSLLTPDQPT